MERMRRREFLGAAAALWGAGALAEAGPERGREAADAAPAPRAPGPGPERPVAIGSANALGALNKVMAMVRGSGRAVDAVVEGAALLEDDPEVESVGLGGIPNEEGVVELDASCMDGETMRAGAVAALRNVQNPSRVAKLVLERTTRVLLVGEGALRFARAHGFKEVNLLTERSRKAWLYWKERLNQRDDWIPGERELDDPEVKRFYERNRGEFWPDGTVHISCLGARGELAGCTSTSGLYFKLPGRVGDSPIIGAGLYVDGRVGAAGSTGWSEGNLQTLGSHSVVEAMRRGMKPEAAALEACRRVVDLLLGKRTEERDAPSRWNLTYYALNAAGQTGAASIWSGDSYAVHDGTRGELRPAAYLYRRG